MSVDASLVSGQERADVAESQADALAVLSKLFRRLRRRRALVCADGVHPLCIRRGAQNEHGVVGKGDTLGLARGGLRVRGRPLRVGILLPAQRHDALRPETHVDDLRATYDIHRLVGMLRNVVRAASVPLDEDMVDRVVNRFFDVLPDQRDCRREGMERRRLVRWMAVDWEAANKTRTSLDRHRGERRSDTYLPSGFTSPSTATSRGTSPPEYA